MMLEIDIPYIHKVRFGIMKVAVIGSRSITAYPLEEVIPPETTEIISGGARGVDALAREYALAHGIPLTEILPDYAQYGKGAPLRRNKKPDSRSCPEFDASLCYYFLSKRIPRVLGPQWLETVQPARV